MRLRYSLIATPVEEVAAIHAGADVPDLDADIRNAHTDYRRPEHTYQKAFNAVRALHFFKLQSEF
jgi:hypothetical protein